MKLSLVFLIIAALVSAADVRTPGKAGRRTDSTFFEHISDQAKFEREGSQKLSKGATHALRFAKAVVAAYVDRETQGEFSIAEAAWGYQVNFVRLRIKEAGGWRDAVEGFGQVYFSKTFTRVEIQYGP